MSTATLTRKPRTVVTATDDRPVASYARRSKRAAGDGQGAYINIADQHVQNAAYAAALFPGAEVVPYDDNMSAWDADKRREGWDRLLADVRAGKVRGVVGRYPDRLTRQPEQGEALLSACRKGSAQLHTTSTGPVESALSFRIMLAIAAEESDQKSRRMNDTHRRLADAGAHHGGRRRFGYEPGMTAIRESEAAIVRELVGRLLAGESLYRLAADLTDREVPTPGGGKWSGPNLGQMLRRPFLAGLRVHKGEVVGKATWTGIITEAEHEQIVALTSEAGRKMNKGSNARKYLLGGLALCDACGAKVRAKPATARDHAVYACTTGRHVQRVMELVDYTVEQAVIGRLSRMDAAGLLTDDVEAQALAELREQRRALDVRYDDVEAEHAAGQMTTRAYSRATARLEADMDLLDAQIVEAAALVDRAPRVLEGMTGEAAATAWAGLGLDRRRAVIDALAEVRLVGGGRGGKWHPEDVVIVWR